MSRGTFYFAADDGSDPLIFETEGTMKRLLGYAKRALPVVRVLYQNRKVELALLAGASSLATEIVRAVH